MSVGGRRRPHQVPVRGVLLGIATVSGGVEGRNPVRNVGDERFVEVLDRVVGGLC